MTIDPSRIIKYSWYFFVPLIIVTSTLRLTGHDQLASDLSDALILVAATAVAVTLAVGAWLDSRRTPRLESVGEFRQGESYWEVTDERRRVVQRGGVDQVNLLTGTCTLRPDPVGRQPNLKPGYTLTTVLEGNRPIDSRRFAD